MKNFFYFLFHTIVETIKVAPTPILVVLGAIMLVIIIGSRKKLKRIPASIFILVGALLLVQLPGFIIQYQQSFAGTLTGIEMSIEELNQQQIDEEINNSRQVARLNFLHQKIKSDVIAFQNARGLKTYLVFGTHFRKRVYETTLKNYQPVIAINEAGWIALAIGGLLGWLFWRLISWPFRKLFKKESKKELQTKHA